MPYATFEELVSIAEESPLFALWSSRSTDVTGQEAAPLLLLILCALRYLGRGWAFDNLSENTGISEKVTRVLFHKFIEFGATVLYQKFVVAPSNAEEAAGHTAEYERAGIPGCVGLTDATHIASS